MRWVKRIGLAAAGLVVAWPVVYIAAGGMWAQLLTFGCLLPLTNAIHDRLHPQQPWRPKPSPIASMLRWSGRLTWAGMGLMVAWPIAHLVAPPFIPQLVVFGATLPVWNGVRDAVRERRERRVADEWGYQRPYRFGGDDAPEPGIDGHGVEGPAPRTAGVPPTPAPRPAEAAAPAQAEATTRATRRAAAPSPPARTAAPRSAARPRREPATPGAAEPGPATRPRPDAERGPRLMGF